jgi:enamine deaminase RidA (YjgF/YER057c/UK114 family)
MPIQRLHPGPRLSEATVFNRTVYLAGQVPTDTSQDIVGQTRQVLAEIDKLLAEANSHKSLLLSVQIFITDMVNFPGMNSVWDEWVPADQGTPARATVEAKLADPACLVEIVAVAAQRD